MEANIDMRQSAKEAELYDNLIIEIELLKGLCITSPPLYVMEIHMYMYLYIYIYIYIECQYIFI